MEQPVSLHELAPDEERAIRRAVTQRLTATDAVLARLMPVDHPIDSIVLSSPELDAALSERAEAEDEEREVHSGRVSAGFRNRARAVHDRRLVRVPGTPVWLLFEQALDRAGPATIYRWVARAGGQTRGVLITIADIVGWTLQPPAEGDQLRVAAVQLALADVQQAVRRGFRAFFETADEDYRVTLAADSGPTLWEPTRDLTS